ncbi:enoyl-CoA hydratase/isomerase family protein [Trujillonella endophytica]|uniref:Enoyl-CoA hydratase/carnithine racemase n=1 Tax=Trujillonella endophytica TaxID=673521 RepID=A0A1H8WHL5_9ACTN|nr:enoyl-CoA hydratase-related protein [Trujillella endophytica]SEP27155.1 Enoyl-CoA hydratase/carnithine racemase [Trujillella endophytica]
MLSEHIDGHVSSLRLERPERLNSFTAADYRDLRLALERARADVGVRVVVLTGAGRAFSSGADRSLLDPAGGAAREGAAAEFDALLATLRSFEKPLLGAVNGLAVGVGCTLLLYCDLLLAAASARFRLPFTALGLVPEAGSSALLPARVRWDAAMWAMLSSEWFDADEAREMGLVWRVVPDASLVDRTTTVATTLAALDPGAVVATKRLLTAGRADVAQRAAEREMAAMRPLSGRPGGMAPTPPPDAPGPPP